MARRLRGALAGAALVAALAGCSSGSPGSAGPLGGPGDPGQECVTMQSGQILAYGFTSVQNGGAAVAVIDRVALADVRGLRVLAAYAIPITGDSLYGVLRGYPPGSRLPAGVRWTARHSADGARVPHTTGHRVTNLLLVIKSLGKRGTASGVDIWYQVGSQRYRLRTATSLLTLNRQCPV